MIETRKKVTKNPRILLIDAEPYPYGMAHTNRLHLTAKGLQENGANVEIIIIAPTENPDIMPRNTDIKGIFQGIPFQYMSGSTSYSRSAVIRKINFYAGFIRCFFRIMNCQSGDCVFFSPYDMFTLLLIRIVTLLKGIILVCEKTEHPYLTNKCTSGKSSIFQRIFIRYVYRLYDGIVVISNKLKTFFLDQTQNRIPVLSIPIIFDPGEFTENSTHILNMIFSSGNLTEEKDGTFTLLRAFALIVKDFPDMQLLIAGDNPRKKIKEKINDLIHDLGLEENVELLGYISRTKYLYYLLNARVHVLAKPNNFQSVYCMPTKLAEFLASGRPVITSDNNGEMSSYLTDCQNAFIASSYDAECFKEKIREVLQRQEVADVVGVNGKDMAFREFDYSINSHKLYEFINTLTSLKNVDFKV